MKRISDLERNYVLEALDNEFRTSKRSIFIQRLEQEFTERFKVNYAVAHANGTCTMHSALAALGIEAEDEVIVPSLTMSSPALAVLHNHSVPVFADVDTDTFTISPQSVANLITERTKAVISVSLYGLPPDYDGLLNICREKGISLIEDNALCIAGKYKGKVAGSFGQFASYSFQGSKHLTCGEGGMLITNSEVLAEKARRFCGLGFNGITASGRKASRDEIQNPDYDRHISLGFNYKMSELCAAVALAQTERADELTAQRIEVAKLFSAAIDGFEIMKPQFQPELSENCYWSYAMVLQTDHPSRDWLRFKELFRKNGGDGFYAAWKLSYNEPLFQSKVQYYDNVWQQYKTGLCPNAEFLQPRLIQLKTNYPDLAEAARQADILHQTLSEYQR